MTKRNRISIDLSDLIGLNFECSKCGTSVTVPIASLDVRMIEQCPNCKQGWGAQIHKALSPTPNHVRSVVDGLQALKQATSDKNAAGFTLTLEVAPSVTAPD